MLRVMNMFGLSSNKHTSDVSPRAAAPIEKSATSADCPLPGGPARSVLVPRVRPPHSILSSSALPERDALHPPLFRLARARGDEARKDAQAARRDRVVVIAAAKRATAHLRDA